MPSTNYAEVSMVCHSCYYVKNILEERRITRECMSVLGGFRASECYQMSVATSSVTSIDPESIPHKMFCIKLTTSGTCALLSVEVITYTHVVQDSTANDWQRNRPQETPNARYAKCFTDSTLHGDSGEDSG